jgi:IclR family KDG regulon transcriptional repressor
MGQSGLRALQLLEDLAVAGPSTLAAMAERLAWHKSTTHRSAALLIDAGYVRQDPHTRRYSATTKVVELASHVLDGLHLRPEVRPILEETARTTGETVHLAVLEGFEIAYVDKVEGRQAVRMASRIGLRGHCHSTALGKVLLAARPQEDWDRYVSEHGLVRRTAQTITDPAALYAELRRVRERGYAVDNVENENGIRCVAVPIRDHTGTVAAAMSLSSWTLSMTLERVQELAPSLQAAGKRASERLGWTSVEADDRP